MSATATMSQSAFNDVLSDVTNHISSKEDIIQEKLERKILSGSGAGNLSEHVDMMPKELKSINLDRYEDEEKLRNDLHESINKFKNNIYSSIGKRDLRKVLDKLGISISNDNPDIKKKKEFNDFMKETRGEHIMVAPGDELAFLGTLGFGISIVLFAIVVSAVQAFIGQSAAGTLVVLACGTLLATISGIAIKKTYDFIRLMYKVFT